MAIPHEKEYLSARTSLRSRVCALRHVKSLAVIAQHGALDAKRRAGAFSLSPVLDRHRLLTEMHQTRPIARAILSLAALLCGREDGSCP